MKGGFYYLHEIGDLIYKRDASDLRESDLVLAFWAIDERDRANAWRILVESLAAGARLARVKELALAWGCNDADAAVYAKRVRCELQEAGGSWVAVPAGKKAPRGTGDSCLEAMASLAKAMGYVPSKEWGNSFKDLLEAEGAKQ